MSLFDDSYFEGINENVSSDHIKRRAGFDFDLLADYPEIDCATEMLTYTHRNCETATDLRCDVMSQFRGTLRLWRGAQGDTGLVDLVAAIAFSLADAPLPLLLVAAQ